MMLVFENCTYKCGINTTGSAIWSGSMDDDEEKKTPLLIFGRKIFRSTKYENVEWKSRTNRKL
jgi:hypothetical protein